MGVRAKIDEATAAAEAAAELAAERESVSGGQRPALSLDAGGPGAVAASSVSSSAPGDLSDSLGASGSAISPTLELADVFSVGCLFFRLCGMRHPFEDDPLKASETSGGDMGLATSSEENVCVCVCV